MDLYGIRIPMMNHPKLDPGFIPMGLYNRAFLADAKKPLGIAVERSDGQLARVETRVHGTAEYAQADKFVTSFKGGYGYDLGQGGKNVSGGQKQRLCIARALLKHPKILILDDSTSAVDTATEAQIRKALQNELSGSTKIIIAQRISSVKDADLIIVMNDGIITGCGTHEELLANNTEYNEIYYSQNDKAEGGVSDVKKNA